MAWQTEGVPFAINAAGVFTDVADVERGLACGCFCPACRGRVVARKGDVNVHHFAHHDQRECRHALETSLFGRLIEIIETPGARMMLPSIWGDSVVIERKKVDLTSVSVNSRQLADSTIDKPDFVLNEPKVEVHVVSYRKTLKALRESACRGKSHALAFDLRVYLKLWWSTCDAARGETINAITTATGLMVKWLEESEDGRQWLHHPGFLALVEQRKAAKAAAESIEARRRAERSRAMQLENAAADAERQRERSEADQISFLPCWIVPAFNAPEMVQDGRLPVGFFKPVKVSWLTDLLAHEYGIVWDSETRRYGYYATQVGAIGRGAQNLFSPSQAWEPIYEACDNRFVNRVTQNQLRSKRTWGK